MHLSSKGSNFIKLEFSLEKSIDSSFIVDIINPSLHIPGIDRTEKDIEELDSDLMKTINNGGDGETPVVNSRYSIVLATAKRARQLIGGDDAFVDERGKKALSIAVEEVNKGFVTIEAENKAEEDEAVVETVEE